MNNICTVKSFVFLTLTLLTLCISCNLNNDIIGLHDDFSHTQGWYEINSSGDSVPPVVKMEVKDGALIIPHKFRTLEFAAEKFPWITSTIDTATNLRKNYGVIDLDKYHYVVLNVKEKGTSSYFNINGFGTKLGYTTGLTVIDLKDYDHKGIKGKQMVKLGINLQDNHTHLTLDDLKFVSKLSKKEAKKLIGAGLTIRDENLDPRPYHGLEALKLRENTPLAIIEEEEMVVFRDDATGAITTRLTATPGDDYFGEGNIWSGDGAALHFISQREMEGSPFFMPGKGKVVEGPKSSWRMWSEEDPDILYLMKRDGKKFMVYAWNKSTDKEELIAEFETPEYTRTFVEFKRFTPLGNIVVAFRETPYFYIVDVKNKKVRYKELSTRLKDASVIGEDNIVIWANCYTYEARWINLDTEEDGLAPSFSAGHSSGGKNGMVANFGGHLNVFVPGDIGLTFTPGDKIKPWANWKNRVVTDYGRLTDDNKFVFTNGTRGDVERQHLMISSEDPGAVMRIARYFTKFSWTSTTYSRPSPDYTKLVYNENMIGSTELQMVYTRRPDQPINVAWTGESISWDQPKRNYEIAGYYLYGSNNSGRDFARLSKSPIKGNSTNVVGDWKYYTVASVEHSGLESLFSNEVSVQEPRSFYFEAEEMMMTPPARRFFDGYANGFQTVRINAESPEESAVAGKVTIPVNELPAGAYNTWARVKGAGKWSVGTDEFLVKEEDWKWVKFDQIDISKSMNSLELTSSDDDLKLDMVLLTKEDFIPEAPYPADGNAPEKVSDVKAVVEGNQVHLSWNPSNATDLHHYSVYCGDTSDFECNNETVIRSVLKPSVTDVLPGNPKNLYYKIIAVDNRWNESSPETVHVN